MKNGIKIFLTSVLLLTGTNVGAGIIFVQVDGLYANPDLAAVDMQHLGNDIIRIQTTGLAGELRLDGADFPPEFEVPASAIGKLTLVQELTLVINLSVGLVEGRASGQLLANDENSFVIEGRTTDSKEIAELHADVRGSATCLPLNGLDCGQLIVDLELLGALSDPYNPASVGRIQIQMFGSMVVDNEDFGIWAAMSANATLGGNEVLINSVSQYASCQGALVVC